MNETLKLDLRKRIPEPEEVMEGSEAENYFLAHRFNPNKKSNVYSITCIDILKRIKINEGKILDIGCGYGALIKQFEYYKPNLTFVGIDFSNSMINIANKIKKGKNIKFYKSKADRLPFKKESFKLIMCKDTFHHFSNPVSVLKEMYRVGKENGSIYITDLKRNTKKEVINEVYEELATKNLVNARQYVDSIKAAYTIKEMKDLFRKAGIRKYKAWEAKVSKNFTKEYGISPREKKSSKNFIKDRWIAIIRKA